MDTVLVAERFDIGVVLDNVGLDALGCSSLGVLTDFLGVGIAYLGRLVPECA